MTRDDQKNFKLIHIAEVKKPKPQLLFLRKLNDICFTWFDGDEKTNVHATTAESAIKEGYLFWKKELFNTLNCGFRYSLPERDEHGNNALFHQMVASYSSMNGIYFDEDLGHNCIVQFTPEKTIKLWKTLEKAEAKST